MKFTSKTISNDLLVSITFDDKFWRSHLIWVLNTTIEVTMNILLLLLNMWPKNYDSKILEHVLGTLYNALHPVLEVNQINLQRQHTPMIRLIDVVESRISIWNFTFRSLTATVLLHLRESKRRLPTFCHGWQYFSSRTATHSDFCIHTAMYQYDASHKAAAQFRQGYIRGLTNCFVSEKHRVFIARRFFETRRQQAAFEEAHNIVQRH